jgi:hypothetical protein
MNDAEELSRLLAAERAEAPSLADTTQGWQGVQSALQANTPALAIAHGPLKLGLSLASKSLLGGGLLAFTVTTTGLGLHEVMSRRAESAVTAPNSVLSRPTAPSLLPPALPNTPASEPPVRSPTPTPTPTPSSREPSTLPQELRLIKAAKQELDAGRLHLAEVWLDEHAARYPNGLLQREREELRERLATPAK